MHGVDRATGGAGGATRPKHAVHHAEPSLPSRGKVSDGHHRVGLRLGHARRILPRQSQHHAKQTPGVTARESPIVPRRTHRPGRPEMIRLNISKKFVSHLVFNGRPPTAVGAELFDRESATPPPIRGSGWVLAAPPPSARNVGLMVALPLSSFLGTSAMHRAPLDMTTCLGRPTPARHGGQRHWSGSAGPWHRWSPKISVASGAPPTAPDGRKA